VEVQGGGGESVSNRLRVGLGGGLGAFGFCTGPSWGVRTCAGAATMGYAGGPAMPSGAATPSDRGYGREPGSFGREAGSAVGGLLAGGARARVEGWEIAGATRLVTTRPGGK